MKDAVLASLMLMAAVAAYARLLAALRRFERGGTEVTWWFGYAYDAVNVLGAALLLVALWIAGYPGPQSLGLALMITLLAYAADAATGRSALPRWVWRATMALVAVATAILAPLRPWLALSLEELLAATLPGR